ncbi:MAG: hypothetical protein J6O40_01570 [Ruminococcus sp.]|nr:hypothetical protein [Ruminococcus sp.]
MKQTVKRSLTVSVLMGLLVMILPYLAPPKLVLRLLPKDIYEAGKAHPAPSRKRQLLGHILTLIYFAYFIYIMKKNTDEIRQENLTFAEAFKRLAAFLYVEKLFDIIVLDQFLCMSSGWYQRFYPETKDCAGWHNRGWNNKQQISRLMLYPIACAVQAYLLTKGNDKA